VPNFMPPVMVPEVADHTVAVDEAQARTAARDLARLEGLCCGISSGAAFAAARQIAERAPQGTAVLTIFPDTGERYLSTDLFADADA
jgi:cysteine synthase A